MIAIPTTIYLGKVARVFTEILLSSRKDRMEIGFLAQSNEIVPTFILSASSS